MRRLIAALARRARIDADARDAGFSLAELIVAMSLSVIIGAMTLTTFVGVESAASSSVDRTVSSSNARSTLLAWSDYLRVADGLTPGDTRTRIVWMTTSDLAFYANLFNRDASATAISVPTLVWLRRDAAGSLVEQQFTNGTATACRVLVTGVGATFALFTAYDSTGAAVSLSTAADTSTGCATLPSVTGHAGVTSALPGITSVTVDFVLPDTRGKHPTEFTAQVSLGGGP